MRAVPQGAHEPSVTLAKMGSRDGVLASALEIVRVVETERLTHSEKERLFSREELAYALRKRDPARRLAARLAAKRAAQSALGGDVQERDISVERRPGAAPTLRLEGAAAARLAAIGAASALVSLTHEGELAAATVLLLEDPKR